MLLLVVRGRAGAGSSVRDLDLVMDQLLGVGAADDGVMYAMAQTLPSAGMDTARRWTDDAFAAELFKAAAPRPSTARIEVQTTPALTDSARDLAGGPRCRAGRGGRRSPSTPAAMVERRRRSVASRRRRFAARRTRSMRAPLERRR